MKSVEALDDYTVKVNSRTHSRMVRALCRFVWHDHSSSHLRAYNGANFADAPANLQAIGTGPYSVDEYRKEDVLIIGGNAVSTVKIIYEVNPYYHDPNKPYFGKVELQGGGGLTWLGRQAKKGWWTLPGILRCPKTHWLT